MMASTRDLQFVPGRQKKERLWIDRCFRSAEVEIKYIKRYRPSRMDIFIYYTHTYIDVHSYNWVFGKKIG